MNNSQDQELIFEAYVSNVLNEGGKDDLFKYGVNKLTGGASRLYKTVFGGGPASPALPATRSANNNAQLAITPQSRELALPATRSANNNAPPAVKSANSTTRKIPTGYVIKGIADAGVVATLGDDDSSKSLPPAPPTKPIRTKTPPSGLANKPLAPKIAAPPAQPADSNPPGTMLSRGLSRLKFKSNPNRKQDYTGPGSNLGSYEKPPSGIKPLFSKGGVFNR